MATISQHTPKKVGMLDKAERIETSKGLVLRIRDSESSGRLFGNIGAENKSRTNMIILGYKIKDDELNVTDVFSPINFDDQNIQTSLREAVEIVAKENALNKIDTKISWLRHGVKPSRMGASASGD